MTTNRAALFDLDGVIIDSETLYTEFWAEIGRKYHQPSPTFALDIKGSTLVDILTRYFPDKEVRERVTEDIHTFEDTMQYQVFDGILDFLVMLREAGFKTAIVTSSDSVKMKYLFSQHPELEQFFDVIINGSMVCRSKPDPEGYLKAAALCDCAPENCFVFEDSFQGIEAGRRSGAKVIAVATTNPAEKLEGKAPKIITTFVGLTPDDLP